MIPIPEEAPNCCCVLTTTCGPNAISRCSLALSATTISNGLSGVGVAYICIVFIANLQLLTNPCHSTYWNELFVGSNLYVRHHASFPKVQCQAFIPKNVLVFTRLLQVYLDYYGFINQIAAPSSAGNQHSMHSILRGVGIMICFLAASITTYRSFITSS
ncbi:uncharacterized protein F4822DRAFT_337640 [Hypoxylon trugodes]|uniref:uncharacterized protein n=1 Tax=Hypoxylon trugodes TaxID=326681 RepID=UPI002196D7E7|nr:uncharacterized protein F4822DRAFT_337640 [Hypoxylon trugodes]KAI1385222.1 hypothetical protein F4822DRAFT_337640 [Hypoxylon trugodes]